jgi:hypothetical protein
MMTEYRFVASLPELIPPDEYPDDPGGDRVRIRIGTVNGRLEILGDAARAETLERLLEALGPEAIEQMLCG